MAAAHPGPQCIALDNKGAVARWSQLLQIIKSDRLMLMLRGRPWGLRPDGDVWEAAANLIQHKGPDNIKVLWTKGHATEEDVRSGKSTAEHRRGNEIADLLAGAAHDLQLDDKIAAGQLATARWTAARRVVRAVHAFLREALVERETLRKQKPKAISENAKSPRRDEVSDRTTMT